MAIRVVAQEWSDILQDYVEIPLDDADRWTIKMASQINGRDMTEDEIIALFNGADEAGELPPQERS